ncbi:MAG: hypothetical protein RIB46_01280 [Pseudomonadales bacterium]
MTADEWRRLLLTISPIYLLFVALIYHGTYWQAFGLNILQFTTPGDIVAMAVFPIAEAITATAIGAMVAIVLLAIRKKLSRIISILVLLISIPALLLGGSGFAFVVLSVSAGILLAFGKVDIDQIGGELRSIGLIILFYLPAAAYLQADSDSSQILNEDEYMFSYDGGEKARLVGYVGGNVFLLSEYSENLVIRRLDSTVSLQLYYYPRFPKERAPIDWLIEALDDF